jgi:hypothetical protein
VAVQSANVGAWSTSGRANGTYTYVVQGCNAGGCSPSSGGVVVTVTLIPLTPTGLTLSVTGTAAKPTVHLSWNATANATSYKLEYTNPPNAATIAYNGAATTFSLLTLANGSVEYRVLACNATGCSPYSAYVITQLASGGCTGAGCSQ